MNKELCDANDYAESWEVADLPEDVSVILNGEHEGRTLHELLESHRDELLGIHSERDRFPLLIKYLDANRDLSIQVHPGSDMKGKYPGVTTGKAEMWVVLAAEPGSKIYAGLKDGVDQESFENALANGKTSECLHSTEVQPGDSFFMKPGTVHSLGTGILVAEIQQPNNITFRLDDWGRKGPDGKPRELHLELGLQVTDYESGPVSAIQPSPISGLQNTVELVNNDCFVVHRHDGESEAKIADDSRAHVLMLISGTASSSCTSTGRINKGETIVLPAARGTFSLQLSPDAILLDAFLN